MGTVDEAHVSETPIQTVEPVAPLLEDRWQRFSDHVRSNPSALTQPPEELAAEFDLPEDFVRSFLIAMRAPVEQVSYLEVAANVIKLTLAMTVTKTRASFQSFTERPLLCLLVSTLLGFGFVSAVIVLRTAFRQTDNFIYTGLTGSLVGAVIITTTMVHGTCLYRHARMRHALLSSLLMFAVWMIFLSAMITGESRAEIERSGLGALPIFLIGSLFMAGAYFVFATTAVLIGGYARYRRESLVEQEVSRQVLLDRLFQIDSRLSTLLASDYHARSRWIDKIRVAKTYYLNVMFWGIALGMLEVLIYGIYSQISGGADTTAFASSWPLVATMISFFVLKAGSMTLFGFIGGRPMRSMSAILAFWAGVWIAHFFPLAQFGPQFALGQVTIGNLLMVGVTVALLGTVTGYLALVEERNYRNQQLRNDDPASLLAERIRIQWRLGLGQQASTVMVVDVARSTMMKANADPLKVEWSFREYQHLVDDICRNNGGHVLSTAGDGAVAAFQNPELAVIAARQILGAMADFNMRRNRLDKPFRLRIGIHSGRTEARLTDAPFNEVIDIAAHIESFAPVGGLAVSRTVVDAVKKFDLTVGELEEVVDGEQVFVVLNPLSEK